MKATPNHANSTGAAGEQLSFLPTPEFCPILPPPNSAAERALLDLANRDLTQIDWLNEGKGWRLAAAVKELDYLGWEPKSISVKCQDWSRAIARYSLSDAAKRAVIQLRQGTAYV